MSKFVRAQDIRIFIRTDGDPLVPLSINSGTFNRGMQMEEVPVVGNDVPEVDGFNGIKQLVIDLNVRSTTFHTLLDTQELKNLSDATAIDTIIDAEFSIDFGRAGRVRYVMPDCVVHEPGTTFSGGPERVTDSLTLTSSRLRRL